MNKLEFFKKLKRFSPIEHSISVVGFLFLILCLCCSLLYLDYGAGARRLMSRARVTWLGAAIGSLSRNGDVGFGEVGDGGGECDLFDGKWVWDETYPLYDSKDCMFLDAGFRCSENGRPDSFYTKWRWQPRTCNLPRFDAKMMLEKLRNRRLVFVGDSIGRNQWESLLCMLASVIPDKASVYEVNGSPITKHTGFLVFKFRDYNCTIEYYRAPFLVLQSRAPAGASEFVKTTLKLDKMDWTASRWKDADLLIFNSGHWWNYEKTVRGGCYFQERNEVKMNMTVEHAFRLSVETLIRWIDEQVNTSKTHIFLRSYAPVHFRGGDWKTGGSCHMEKLPDLSSPFTLQMWPHFSIVNDVLFKHSNASRKVNLLNVTYMTSQRREGHSSLYYLGSKLAPLHRQDCSHWCLPGVPDAWNELLYAVFMKLESIRSQNSTRS